jgi:hypothetical protein
MLLSYKNTRLQRTYITTQVKNLNLPVRCRMPVIRFLQEEVDSTLTKLDMLGDFQSIDKSRDALAEMLELTKLELMTDIYLYYLLGHNHGP